MDNSCLSISISNTNNSVYLVSQSRDKVHVGIVNNGFMETIFNVDNGDIIHKCFLNDESEDAYSVIDDMRNSSGKDIEVVSYGYYC